MKIHNITFRYSVLHMKIVYLTHEVVTNKDHTPAAVQASNSQLHPDASSSLQLFGLSKVERPILDHHTKAHNS